MKVLDTDNYKLVFSIKKHQRLGTLLEPFVIAYTPSGTLSLTYQKIFSGNASYYTKLTKQELEWVALLDDVRPEQIVKLYSKKQKIRPKEYFAKHFDKEVFDKEIRPFIDSKQNTLIRSLPIDNNQVYLSDEINPAHKRIQLTYEFAKVLFHLRRNENGTNYFATIKHKDKRIPFMKLGGLMISKQPAVMVVNGVLYKFFDFVDGARLAIFINRKFVHIPKHKEKHYYNTFVKKLMETSPIFCDGIVVKQEEHQAQIVLSLSNKGGFGFDVLLDYGSYRFKYTQSKHTHVDLKWEGENPVFTKVRRSKIWEENQILALETLGLRRAKGSFLRLENSSLPNTLNWLSNNEQVLTHANITLESSLDTKYVYQNPKIAYKIKDQNDWFDLNIIVEIGGFKVAFRDIAKKIKQGDTEYVLPDGSVFLLPEAWFTLAESLEKTKLSNNGSYHVGKYQLDILDQIKSRKIKQHLQKLIDIQEETPHKNFNGNLRPYQVDGLSWLMFLKNNNFGGILADDMGLGKTVQTLAFLQKILADKNVIAKPLLLVAPTSLLYNWKAETERFTPEIQVLIHAGAKREQDASFLSRQELVITSYGLIRNDFEIFKSVEFRCIVLDESQYIKNRTSKTSKCIYQLISEFRIALTGTPIENSISDLWSQMHFLNKNLLGSARQFEEFFVKPIEKDQDSDKAEELRKLVKPFILRRTKDEVAKELPEMTEKIVFCDMSAEQSEIYESTKSAYRNSLLNLIKDQGLAKSKLNVLQGITKLRQISNHPKLADGDYLESSGKHITVMRSLITAVNQGHKVLVFSQFVKYLELLSRDLIQTEFDFHMLTGASTKEQRDAMVKDFQSNDETKVFLISLKAGGTGLNLTAADYVFIVDPWWNPAAEAQARDRSHRIGQKKSVFTYKFISTDTIEEKIINLQKRKSKYAKDIILSENNVLKNLDTNQLRKLFD